MRAVFEPGPEGDELSPVTIVSSVRQSGPGVGLHVVQGHGLVAVQIAGACYEDQVVWKYYATCGKT